MDFESKLPLGRSKTTSESSSLHLKSLISEVKTFASTMHCSDDLLRYSSIPMWTPVFSKHLSLSLFLFSESPKLWPTEGLLLTPMASVHHIGEGFYCHISAFLSAQIWEADKSNIKVISGGDLRLLHCPEASLLLMEESTER